MYCINKVRIQPIENKVNREVGRGGRSTSGWSVLGAFRCISINFPRKYIHLRETYPRASQPHFNFPRIYLLSLAVYSRASGVHYDLRGNSLRIGDEFIANPAVFKKLVSGDRVTVERKGQDPFDFCNYSKFIFSANNIPRIKDKTGAVLDRLVIVPFNATFSKSDEDYDPYIKYKLRSPEAMEYLIQLALDGLKRVLKNNGFTMCQAVQEELEEYSEQNNPIIGFFKELDLDIDILNQPTKDIYLRYKLYCNENGFTPMSSGEFSKLVRKEYGLEIKVTTINGKSVRVFRR